MIYGGLLLYQKSVMKIRQVPHRTLNEVVAGRLAASIMEGGLRPGEQLPPERELMSQLGVSRATLREALKALAENRLIEARPGVGWFARAIDQNNMAQAHELARVARPDAFPEAALAPTESPP